MAKEIIFGEEARKALQAGVDQIANAVKVFCISLRYGSGKISYVKARTV